MPLNHTHRDIYILVWETATLGKSEQVLSFSFEVDDTGEIDYDVRAGIIKNVSRVTYMPLTMRWAGDPFVRPEYPFGGEPPSSIRPLEMHQLADTKTFKEVTDRMLNRSRRSESRGIHVTAGIDRWGENIK